MDTEFFYNQNKSLSDEQLLDKYESLALHSTEKQDKNMLEIVAIMSLCQERNLSIAKHIQGKSKKRMKQESKVLIKNYRKDGWKFLILGALIFGVGFAITAGSGGKMLFYGALITGALLIIVGLFLLTTGFGLDALLWWKHRK